MERCKHELSVCAVCNGTVRYSAPDPAPKLVRWRPNYDVEATRIAFRPSNEAPTPTLHRPFRASAKGRNTLARMSQPYRPRPVENSGSRGETLLDRIVRFDALVRFD